MNRKLASGIAAGVMSAGALWAESGLSVPPLSLESGVAFDTEHLHRGSKLGQQVFTPGLRVSASLFDQGELYFDNRNFLGAKSSDFNKHDFSLGFSCDVTDIFNLDLGFTAHLMRNVRKWWDAGLDVLRADIDAGVRKAQGIAAVDRDAVQAQLMAGYVAENSEPEEEGDGHGEWERRRNEAVEAGFEAALTAATEARRQQQLAILEETFPGVTRVAFAPGRPAVADAEAKYLDGVLEYLTSEDADEDSLTPGAKTPSGRILPHFGITDVKSLGIKKHSYEFHVSAMANVLLNPRLIYRYDFTWKRHNLEGAISHIHDLSTFGANGFAVELQARVGYDRTRRPYGMKANMAKLFFWDKGLKKNYFYYGAGADLVYSFSENARVRGGLRYEGLSRKKAWAYTGHRNHVWFSTSFDCSF